MHEKDDMRDGSLPLKARKILAPKQAYTQPNYTRE
jgi:hypothetical protein